MALTGKTDEEKIWRYLKAKGLNDYSAAGCMGNLYAESGLNPKNLQNSYERKLHHNDNSYTKAVDSGAYTNFVRDKAGYGLAQWTFWSRKQNMLNFMKKRGLSIGDLEGQLDFLWSELSTYYRNVLSKLSTASSVREASDTMLLEFEKPANMGITVQLLRYTYSMRFYNKFSNKPSKGSGGAGASLPSGGKDVAQGGSVLEIGTIVEFNGNRHYPNSMSANATPCKPGMAKLTAISKGSKHEYHLIRIPGGGSTVYGWVNGKDIVHNTPTSPDNSSDKLHSDSPLVSYTCFSPNHSGVRTHSIDRITPHCVVGQLSVETMGVIFKEPSRKASCQYGIGTDGRIGQYCREGYRSWCSSSNSNDQRAVTIECASDKTHPYAMNDKVYQSLINLCVDVCKRNGIKKLLWLGGKEQTLSYEPKEHEAVLTAHRWFANKECPGEWLYSRYGDLAAKVNAKLGCEHDEKPAEFRQYTVKIVAPALNCRTGPGTNYKVACVIHGGGIYTIIEESQSDNGIVWGRLKSGAGWISLKYTKRIK